MLAKNTVGLHQLGGRVVAVTGLAHLGTNEGILYRLAPDEKGRIVAKPWLRLPGAPLTSGFTREGRFFIRTYGGDVLVEPSE